MDKSTGSDNSNSTVAESEIEFLYKYRELNEKNEERVERIFTHSELYFASPRQFNDPFDSKVQLSFRGNPGAPLKLHQRYLVSIVDICSFG